MKHAAAEILREYGPFPGVEGVHGVSFDGQQVWFATGDRLNALDPETGEMLRALDIAAHAGTAFDGEYLFQIAEAVIRKIDPKTGEVVGSIPAPGAGGDSGLAARSIKSIPRRERFSAPSNPTVSSPASPGSTASSGTAHGRTSRATCDASIRRLAKCWKASKCRLEPASRGLNPMAATAFFAGAEAAER
jgi:hypothetical protein